MITWQYWKNRYMIIDWTATWWFKGRKCTQDYKMEDIKLLLVIMTENAQKWKISPDHNLRKENSMCDITGTGCKLVQKCYLPKWPVKWKIYQSEFFLSKKQYIFYLRNKKHILVWYINVIVINTLARYIVIVDKWHPMQRIPIYIASRVFHGLKTT